MNEWINEWVNEISKKHQFQMNMLVINCVQWKKEFRNEAAHLQPPDLWQSGEK